MKFGLNTLFGKPLRTSISRELKSFANREKNTPKICSVGTKVHAKFHILVVCLEKTSEWYGGRVY